MFIDPHIHTNASPCGKATLNEMIRQAIHLELDAICITDHDQLIRVPKIPDLRIFAGEEISSYGGHILAYGIQETIPYALDDLETIDRIHEQGGIAIAAHPYRRRLGRPHVNRRIPPPWSLGDEVLNLPLDGIETLNGGNQHHENRHAHKIAKLKNYAVLGGSDAHRIQNLGAALTYCRENIETIDDFLDIFRKKTSRTLLLQQKKYFMNFEEEMSLETISSPFGIEPKSAVTVGINLYVPSNYSAPGNGLFNELHRIWQILQDELAKIINDNNGTILSLPPKYSVDSNILIHFETVVPEIIIDRMEVLRRKIECEGKIIQTTTSIGIVIHSQSKTYLPTQPPSIPPTIQKRTQVAVSEAIRRGGNQLNIR